MAEGRVNVDGTVLHINPGKIVSGIAYQFADGRVREADGCAYTECSPRYFSLNRSTLFMVMSQLPVVRVQAARAAL